MDFCVLWIVFLRNSEVNSACVRLEKRVRMLPQQELEKLCHAPWNGSGCVVEKGIRIEWKEVTICIYSHYSRM